MDYRLQTIERAAGEARFNLITRQVAPTAFKRICELQCCCNPVLIAETAVNA
jgi:hypothetical protein